MDNKNIETKARQIAEPLISNAGYALWDVVFEKEGAMSYLRILFDAADKDNTINDEDCAAMTAPLNALMDKQDFIKHVDILEVGSPGLTRKLRRAEHFTQSIGKPVRALKRGEKGKTTAIHGELTAYSPELDEITLKTDGENITLNLKNCLKINLDL